MRRLLLAAAGTGLLAACSTFGFNAFNLRTTADSCTLVDGKRELRLEFDYTGTLNRLGITFTPNGKPAETVSIPNLDAQTPGFTLNTRGAGLAKINIDLGVIQPSASGQAISQPNPRTLYPMNITVRAGDGSSEKTLELKNVDVASCYGL